jgi:hypothetical protein
MEFTFDVGVIVGFLVAFGCFVTGINDGLLEP